MCITEKEPSTFSEQACDDCVVAAGERASDYATELVSLAETHHVLQTVAAVSMARTCRLEARIRSMLDRTRSHLPMTRRWAIGLFGAASLMLLLVVTVQPVQRYAEADEVVTARDAAAEAAEIDSLPDPLPEQSRTDSLGDLLPDGARLRLGTLRFRHPSTVIELALSPDEKTIATIGSRELIVWDVSTGKKRWGAGVRIHGIMLPGAAYGIRALAFTSDSSRFYTPGGHNEVIVWDVSSGHSEVVSLTDVLEVTKANQPPTRVFGVVRAVDVTPDGQRLAVGSTHGMAVCDAKGQVQFAIPNKPEAPVEVGGMNRDRLMFGGHYSFGSFSPDGKTLAVVTSDSPEEIRLFDSETGQELRRFKLKSRLVRLAFSPDGKRIVTTERDIAVRLYAIDSGKQIWSFEIKPTTTAESYTSAVAYSPDAKLIAACAPIGSDYDIYLLDAATGKAVGRLSGHTWKPWALAFTADSTMLYSSGWDGAVRRWDVSTRQQLAPPEGVRATAVTAASPDGQTLAYEDDSGTIHLVDAKDAKELRQLELPGTQYSQLTFSPDGRYLAGGGTSGEKVHVAVWDVSDGEVVHRWDWPKGRDPHSSVNSLCFTPDGRRLAGAVFRQSSVFLWDLTIGLQIAQLQHEEVYGLSFSPDGETLATAGWDKVLRFWETDTAELHREINLADDVGNARDLRMYTVCYAPAGGLIATAHLDGTVRIWDATAATLRNTFQVDGRFVYGAISFSPDGSWLATGSMDGRVVVWDPLTAERMWDVGQHQSYVYTVSFGRDNRALLSGGDDGVCYLWDLQPGQYRSRTDLRGVWEDLARGNGPAAFRAMCVLTAMPDRAVTLLAKNVRPGDISTNSDRVREWIVDLDSSEPATREAARASLASVGSVAAEPLRRASVENAPPERTSYLKKLLARVEAIEMTERRAASLLAKLGTPRARRLLKGWASQDPNGALGRSSTDLQRFGGN